MTRSLHSPPSHLISLFLSLLLHPVLTQADSTPHAIPEDRVIGAHNYRDINAIPASVQEINIPTHGHEVSREMYTVVAVAVIGVVGLTLYLLICDRPEKIKDLIDELKSANHRIEKDEEVEMVRSNDDIEYSSSTKDDEPSSRRRKKQKYFTETVREAQEDKLL